MPPLGTWRPGRAMHMLGEHRLAEHAQSASSVFMLSWATRATWRRAGACGNGADPSSSADPMLADGDDKSVIATCTPGDLPRIAPECSSVVSWSGSWAGSWAGSWSQPPPSSSQTATETPGNDPLDGREYDQVARRRSMSRSALLAAAARREIARPTPSDVDDAIIGSEQRFRTAGRFEAADLVRWNRDICR